MLDTKTFNNRYVLTVPKYPENTKLIIAGNIVLYKNSVSDCI